MILLGGMFNSCQEENLGYDKNGDLFQPKIIDIFSDTSTPTLLKAILLLWYGTK